MGTPKSEAEKALELLKQQEQLRAQQQVESQKKLEEENKKKQEFLDGVPDVISAGFSTDLGAQSLIGKFGSTFAAKGQVMANDLKAWDKAIQNQGMTGAQMAAHPLMKNPMVKGFATAFANQIAKLDKNSGGMLSKASPAGMALVNEFNNTMNPVNQNTGLMKKLGNAAVGLATGGGFGATMGKFAANILFNGAKNLLSMANQNQNQEQTKKSSLAKQLMSAMKPTPPSKG